MKNIYFLSDAHLGSLAIPHARTQERRLVNFLDSIKHKADAIYLLGDIFDFWHEYKYVVPKGYTRLLGKISELTDMGVEVHFFTGNHDLWVHDYLFHNATCQRLFAALHPRWGMAFGLEWARRSRMKRVDGKEPEYQGEDNEELIRFAKDYLSTHPDINYFIFGHRHIELDLMLSRTTRAIILGDWITEFSYAVFDGEHMLLEEFVEGETQP